MFTYCTVFLISYEVRPTVTEFLYLNCCNHSNLLSTGTRTFAVLPIVNKPDVITMRYMKIHTKRVTASATSETV